MNTPLRRAAAMVEAFLATQAASGVVLLVAATAALIAANSSLGEGYFNALEMLVGVGGFERSVHWWINDALMCVFFFVVGLELRREISDGELSEWRRSALPAAAALGGMLCPALLYLAFNHGHPSAVGWGIPMATDIAFAVGVFALLGPRVAPALRVLLLALAVIDDLGAIGVIALFYGGDGAGVHPTVFAVLAGLLVRSERLEHALHGAVAYGVMPIFAFANAGVALGSASLAGDGWRVFLGILVGLVLGKPLGVYIASRLAVGLGVATVPRGVGWSEVGVVGLAAGIGFTMALFIAQLAFPPGPMLETAKLAILAASVVAGVGALVVGRGVLPAQFDARAAATEREAEVSTET